MSRVEAEAPSGTDGGPALRRRFRGYDRIQVDIALERAARTAEALQRRVRDLNSRVESVESERDAAIARALAAEAGLAELTGVEGPGPHRAVGVDERVEATIPLPGMPPPSIDALLADPVLGAVMARRIADEARRQADAMVEQRAGRVLRIAEEVVSRLRSDAERETAARRAEAEAALRRELDELRTRALADVTAIEQARDRTNAELAGLRELLRAQQDAVRRLAAALLAAVPSVPSVPAVSVGAASVSADPAPVAALVPAPSGDGDEPPGGTAARRETVVDLRLGTVGEPAGLDAGGLGGLGTGIGLGAGPGRPQDPAGI
jgi:hypothetical protein